jgi:hypothetical protein
LDNVPDDLFRRIKELAEADRVPVAEETVQLLKQAVLLKQPARGRPDRSGVLAILDQLRRNPIVPAPGTPDSVDLLREDRSR